MAQAAAGKALPKVQFGPNFLRNRSGRHFDFYILVLMAFLAFQWCATYYSLSCREIGAIDYEDLFSLFVLLLFLWYLGLKGGN